jgi:hypothetical protein
MYPRLEPALALGVIAQDWGRDLPQHPPASEVFSLLVQAIWRGDLRLRPAETDESGSDPRARLLGVLRAHPDHPGLLFVDCASDAPTAMVHLPDGGILADLRVVVIWPKDPAKWTAEMLTAACAALAEAKLDDYAGEAVAVYLHSEMIDQAAFAAFCKRRGYALPAFWFRGGLHTVARGAEERCRTWLRTLVQGHGEAKPQVKERLFQYAQEKFPTLSPRAFERIWAAEAPSSWKRGGRPSSP